MLYLGLMSGTSMDGIDVALVNVERSQPRLLDFETFQFPTSLVSKLQQLCYASDDELILMGHCDRQVAEVFANACLELLQRNLIRPDQVKAIGSHGQTIRHIPTPPHAFSLQIGDPNTLAALTGIDVIADFRRKDIALGGQGAPLVPAFHQAVFSSNKQHRVVLNIGGIANISYLPADPKQTVLGYDTGPGNTLLDAWCQKHLTQCFDHSGAWAAGGKTDGALLSSLLEHRFFAEIAPKSTGREAFHLDWLEQQLIGTTLSPQTVQATLVALTCRSIAMEIRKLPKVQQVYVCGGGAYNDFMMASLASELFDCEVHTTDELGIRADAVEAMAFAWFAYAHQQKLPANIPEVTGASRRAILGAYYPAA